MNNFFLSFLNLKINTREGGECQAGKFTIFSNGLRIISAHGALLCNIVVKERKRKQGEESCEGAQNFPFDLFVVPETALLASATVLPQILQFGRDDSRVCTTCSSTIANSL